MSLRSWIDNIKKRRAIKRAEKRRQEFSFLIEMIRSEQAHMIDEMQCYEKKVDSVLFDINKKVDEILISYHTCWENIGRTLEKLEETTCNSMAVNSDKMIAAINEGVPLIRNDIVSRSSGVEGKTDKLLLSIEEIKELMKIVAVNNLMDEI